MLRLLTIGFFVFFCHFALAFQTIDDHEFLQWLNKQQTISLTKLLQNISPTGTLPGTVIASPQRSGPDYYFHWVRDAGLTMQTVFVLFEKGIIPAAQMETMFFEYLEASKIHQNLQTKGHRGEAKIRVNGTSFDEHWCRPQNDSPALRASALIKWANNHLQHGNKSFVERQLYTHEFPNTSAIKSDLEYVAHNWQKPGCDLWEEVFGQHFYTRMVQRKALLDGAKLARQLGDEGAAVFYEQQAALLANEIEKHWDSEKGILAVSLDIQYGPEKPKKLDAAVILGILHGYADDGFLKPSDAKVIATAMALEREFKKLYPINLYDSVGTAIGRYPEDTYSGTDEKMGHPWVLITAAFARLYYLAAEEVLAKNHIGLANIYFERAESFLKRIRLHTADDGALSEQFHRETGFMISAAELTWSHAEFLEAKIARQEYINKASHKKTRSCLSLFPH